MPEGHTIHRIKNEHNASFSSQKLVVLSPQGRFSEGAKLLSGRQLNAAEAYGKHLFYHWSGRKILHVHLGLYGKFRLFKNPAPEPRGAVRVRMIGDYSAFDLNGPNRCELFGRDDYNRLLQRVGPDPLREDADPESAWQKINRSRATIGSLLLNQSVIAGIGNVYRAEILFRLRIHPDRPGKELARNEFDELWQMAVELMSIGVKYNRIITVSREQIGKPLSRANASERLNIYKKPECPECQSDIYYWASGGRTIYACESCQV